MQALLATGLAAGGLGFSSTWSTTHNDHNGDPVPSRHASREELVASVLGGRGAPGHHARVHPGRRTPFGEDAVRPDGGHEPGGRPAAQLERAAGLRRNVGLRGPPAGRGRLRRRARRPGRGPHPARHPPHLAQLPQRVHPRHPPGLGQSSWRCPPRTSWPCWPTRAGRAEMDRPGAVGRRTAAQSIANWGEYVPGIESSQPGATGRWWAAVRRDRHRCGACRPGMRSPTSSWPTG